MDANTCSAWRAGTFCHNGFTITPACNPGRIQPARPPQCCDEEWCGKVYPEIGRPLLDSERAQPENPDA